MSDTHVNRLKCTVSGTPGTGTITVSTAASGFRTFASGDGGKTFSCLFVDGTAWEVATGCTYTHSGTTLTRGTLEESSTGSAISLTSAATVSVIAPASLGNIVESLRWIGTFTPVDNQPPATGFATFDTRNSIAVYDFSPILDETVVFVGVVPPWCRLGSGISVRLFWMVTSAVTSGDVRWQAEVERWGTDNDTASFDTATAVTTTCSGTNGVEVVSTITCTAIDSLAVGDRFRLRVTRLGNSSAADTCANDAELVAVEVRTVI